jgi:hypothetical protein
VNQELPDPAPGWLSQVVRSTLLVLAAAVALGLLLIAAKHWRRRRRARGSPADRVTGAWLEATERLRAYGLAVPASATATTTGLDARARFGAAAESVPVLAELVTTTVFGSAPTTSASAAAAWELDERLRDELRRSLGLVLTIRVHLDPRPLLGRSARR